MPVEAKAQLSDEQATTLFAVARREHVSVWPPLSPTQLQALHAKARTYLENYQRYHQPFGLTVDVLFSGHDRAVVEKLDGAGDAATWTGHYLAALAFRYAVTKEAAVLADIHRVLDAFEVLIHVSGKEGFIARFAGPADDPAYRRYYSVYGDGPDPARPGLGTWAFRGLGKYSHLVWLGNPSRDVYIGVNFGLATACRLVPEAAIRARIRNLAELIVNQLIHDSWLIVDGEGRKGRSPPTPATKAALLRTAASVNPGKYQRAYEQATGPVLASPAPNLCKHCSYFHNNLEFATYYVLATLETDRPTRAHYQNKLKSMWQQCSDHLNAYFAAVYLSATGDTSDMIAQATVQGGLIDFPAPPRWDRPTDHSSRTDLQFTEVSGARWAQYSLLVRERVPTDFLWQRSPCQLRGGSGRPLEYPGIDFFLPYWMARHCGIIPPVGRDSVEP